MKKNRDKKIIVFRLLVLVFFCTRCLALQDEIGNPAVPPSSVKSGLVKSPNPVDTTGNLTVTGNVSGLAYFHGLVPYRAPTQFGAPMGSDDISSFLRRSAPINSSRSQLSPQPYYLPSSTVSSLAPSALGTVLTYPSIRANKGTGEFVAPQAPKIEKKLEIPAASPLYDYSRTRPLSYEPTDVERMITYELIREKTKKELSQALQKATGDIYKIDTEVEQAKQPAEGTLSVPQPAEPAKPLEPSEPLQPGRIPETEAKQPAGKDIYEQMLEDIKKAPQLQKVPQPAEQNQPQEEDPAEFKSELAKIEKETADAFVGVHKSFAAQAKDKFNYYMRTAEEFLKQGKYYSAVDAYTLASVYKPGDPLAYAGRAHALFTSGEYMSSAYFLARAINIFPEYVNFKIDLNAMIPDTSQFEGRITDVKQWAEKTKSAELNFLLAYVYYQLDKTDLALAAINSAAEKMPDNIAIKVLKQAIEKKAQ